MNALAPKEGLPKEDFALLRYPSKVLYRQSEEQVLDGTMFSRGLKKPQARKTQSTITNMKIKTQQTVDIECTLDSPQQKNVTATFLEKLLDWDRAYYVEDGFVKNVVTCYGSHSWNTVETVRKATPNDDVADRLFRLIYNRPLRPEKNLK